MAVAEMGVGLEGWGVGLSSLGLGIGPFMILMCFASSLSFHRCFLPPSSLSPWSRVLACDAPYTLLHGWYLWAGFPGLGASTGPQFTYIL